MWPMPISPKRCSIISRQNMADWIFSSNNVAHSSKGGILDITLEEWNRILAINLTGYFLRIQHAGKMMKAQGSGSISISAASGDVRAPAAPPIRFPRRGEFAHPTSRR